MTPVKKEEANFDDSDIDMAQVTSRRRNSEPTHVIDISDDDVLEEGDDGPCSSNASQRVKRQRRKVDYKEEDSDDENQEPRKVYICIGNMAEFIKKFRTQKAMGNYPHIEIANQKIDMDACRTFFKKKGKSIETLCVTTINWKLLQMIGNHCPKLTTLSIRPTQGYYSLPEDAAPIPRNMKFQFSTRLKTLSLDVPNPFWRTISNLFKLLRAVSGTLETFQYTFNKTEDVNNLLEVMTKTNNISNLKSLVIKYAGMNEDRGEVVLRQNQLRGITNLKLPKLERLGLICGIWEDVTGADLEGLLVQFAPTLKHFTIAGNLHGIDLADQQLNVKVPPMPLLESFNFGSIYEFEEDCGQDEQIRLNGAASAPVLSLANESLIAITVTFPELPTLQSLSLGNMVSITQLCPKLFPDLRTLRVSSNWTVVPLSQTVNSAADLKFPEFPVVRDLQLPDCMVDEFFVSRILEMFPSVKSVRMNLPTARCLRHFFNAMQKSALQYLHVKTSYDFSGSLEYAFFGPGLELEGLNLEEDEGYKEILKLKDEGDGHGTFEKFVRFYSIELPVSNEDDAECTVAREGNILDLVHLKTLVIDHVPRTIRIPLDNTVPHDHPTQTFHPHLQIGFKQYPLSRKFVDALRQLKNLDKFIPGSNISVPEERGTGQSRTGEFPIEWNKVEYTVAISQFSDDDSVEGDMVTDQGEETKAEDSLPPPQPEVPKPYWSSLGAQVITGSGELPTKFTNLKRKVSRRAAMTLKEPKIKKEKMDEDAAATDSSATATTSPAENVKIKPEKS